MPITSAPPQPGDMRLNPITGEMETLLWVPEPKDEIPDVSTLVSYLADPQYPLTVADVVLLRKVLDARLPTGNKTMTGMLSAGQTLGATLGAHAFADYSFLVSKSQIKVALDDASQSLNDLVSSYHITPVKMAFNDMLNPHGLKPLSAFVEDVPKDKPKVGSSVQWFGKDPKGKKPGTVKLTGVVLSLADGKAWVKLDGFKGQMQVKTAMLQLCK